MVLFEDVHSLARGVCRFAIVYCDDLSYGYRTRGSNSRKFRRDVSVLSRSPGGSKSLQEIARYPTVFRRRAVEPSRSLRNTSEWGDFEQMTRFKSFVFS